MQVKGGRYCGMSEVGWALKHKGSATARAVRPSLSFGPQAIKGRHAFTLAKRCWLSGHDILHARHSARSPAIVLIDNMDDAWFHTLTAAPAANTRERPQHTRRATLLQQPVSSSSANRIGSSDSELGRRES